MDSTQQLDEKQQFVLGLVLALRDTERELKLLKKVVADKRRELLELMVKEDWTSWDIPGHVRLTLVEYIKETVSEDGIRTVKQLLPPEEVTRIIMVKESIDKEGIKHLRVLLTPEQLVDIIGQTPVRYVKLTDRTGKE